MSEVALAGMAARPGYGTQGREIDLFANVYQMRINPQLMVHHYDVQIAPVSTRPEGEESAPRPGRKGPGGAIIAEQERRLPLSVCLQVWDALPSQYPDLAPIIGIAAYDGRKSAFTPKPFPFGTGNETYNMTLPAHSAERKPREFRVKIEHAQTIDMSVLRLWGSKQPGATDLVDKVTLGIMALDILFRHDQFRKEGVVTAAQGSKFFSAQQRTQIGQRAEVLSGFFHPGNLVKVAFDIVGRTSGGGGMGGGRGRGRGGPPPRGGRGGYDGGQQGHGQPSRDRFSDAEIRQLKMKLRGAKVRVVHRATTQEFSIQGFGLPPAQQTFSKGPKGPKPSATEVAAAAAQGRAAPQAAEGDGERQDIASYFQKTYNFKLQYPNLQVVELKGGAFVPIEAVELLPGAGIPPTRLNPDQAAAMIKVAAKRPDERKQLIEQQRQRVSYQTNQRIAAWGVEAAPQMAQIKGRVLAPPKVQYHPQSKVKEPRVASGAWNLLDTRFIEPGKPLATWGVVCFANERELPIEQLRSFVTMLGNTCKARGINVVNPQPILKYGDYAPGARITSIKEAARDVVMDPRNKTKMPPQLLIFILPRRDQQMYDDVKRCATLELLLPVASQVLMKEKILKDRGLDQYCNNVTMKINAKLFGANWIISPRDMTNVDPKTMMIGADVTHPPPGPAGAGSVSIAAVVGTQTPSQASYAAQVRQQEGRVEIIQDMQGMALALVRGWLAKNGNQRPEKIIFFRDGVSEGQYSTVVDHEIRAIKAACREIDPRYSPKLTYIICAKRHHLRFFATKPNDVDRSGNLPAGTVVDNHVTHPYLFDFYLQAHAGLVGTARPTHYIALLDENGFNADSMQRLVNSMCYGFARATRSVSLIPVAYYADIVCTKSRSFIYMDDDTSSQVSGGSNFDPLSLQKKLDRTSGTHGLASMWFL